MVYFFLPSGLLADTDRDLGNGHTHTHTATDCQMCHGWGQRRALQTLVRGEGKQLLRAGSGNHFSVQPWWGKHACALSARLVKQHPGRKTEGFATGNAKCGQIFYRTCVKRAICFYCLSVSWFQLPQFTDFILRSPKSLFTFAKNVWMEHIRLGLNWLFQVSAFHKDFHFSYNTDVILTAAFLLQYQTWPQGAACGGRAKCLSSHCC